MNSNECTCTSILRALFIVTGLTHEVYYSTLRCTRRRKSLKRECILCRYVNSLLAACSLSHRSHFVDHALTKGKFKRAQNTSVDLHVCSFNSTQTNMTTSMWVFNSETNVKIKLEGTFPGTGITSVVVLGSEGYRSRSLDVNFKKCQRRLSGKVVSVGLQDGLHSVPKKHPRHFRL